MASSCKSPTTWIPFTTQPSGPPRPEPLPQDPVIQTYLNQNPARGADYTDPYRQIERPGDDFEALMVNAINQAQTSIDVAVQELRLPRVAQALIAQHRAGIRVRVIIENTYNQPWSDREPSSQGGNPAAEFRLLADQNRDGQLSPEEIQQADTIIMLRNARVPLIDDTADGSKGSGLMHHKFMIIDGLTTVTGSANWTLSGVHGDMDEPASRGNANNLLVIQHPALAQAFSQEFNLMWGDGPGGR
ncbi:MAG: phospholipase D-like domain-containing protein, partial [Spirulinaceae cyanobacterium]